MVPISGGVGEELAETVFDSLLPVEHGAPPRLFEHDVAVTVQSARRAGRGG
jgi:hypothetical protein